MPLSDVVGTERVPERAALVIGSALDRMVDAGDLGESNRWQGLEWLAADWLGGP